jgi:hypothetical protein
MSPLDSFSTYSVNALAAIPRGVLSGPNPLKLSLNKMDSIKRDWDMGDGFGIGEATEKVVFCKKLKIF